MTMQPFFVKMFASHWNGLLTERLRQEWIVVRRYHRAFLPGAESLLRDFGTVLGLTEQMPISGPPYRNCGYSREALEFARSVNDSLDPAARAALRTLLQEASSRQAFAPFGFFSDEERAALLERCAAGNAEIAERHFPESCGALFPPQAQAMRHAACPEDSLSHEEMDRLLARAKALAGENQRHVASGGSPVRRARRWVGRRVAAHPRVREILRRMAEILAWR